MRAALLAFLVAAPASAHVLPRPDNTADFHPNPNLHPLPFLRDSAPGAVEQVAEIAVLEGDPDIVSDDGMGGYAIEFDQFVQDPVAIAQRFYTVFPDQFDELIVFTTFDDQGSQGALAYETSSKQDVIGLGRGLFDEDMAWGADKGVLHAFVNMKWWDQYRQMDGLDLADPNSSFYPVLGQEFAHRWLSFMHYIDGTGAKSSAMLGRDASHWASTLQADASVMDGDRLVDNGDGTFTNAEAFVRYSPLDLYAMGALPASDVAPWFLVHDAVTLTGKKIDPTMYMRVGQVFKGTREDITLDQVIAADGTRSPAFGQAATSFRVAFVLVTRPGERASDVVDVANKLEQVRKVWEQRFAEMAGGRATMCTQLSAPCGAPTARVTGGAITEAGGNGNGVVEPGEPVAASFDLLDDGPADADAVTLTAQSDGITLASPSLSLPGIASGATAKASFQGTLPSSTPCGQAVVVHLTANADGNTFRGFATVTPGLTSAYDFPFDHGGGLFSVDAAGTDTTHDNAWQLGYPLAYYGRFGFTFQPDGCANGGQTCWFTGLERGHRGVNDSSVGVGKTTLWSPALDLSTTYQPVLHYSTWFEALDFSNPSVGGQVASGISLDLEASADGGQTWTMLDSVDGATPSWQRRDVPLDGKIPFTRGVLLRWTAQSPAPDQIVEAGIDDVSVATLTPACNPNAAKPPIGVPEDAGCSLSGRSRGGAVFALVLLAFVGLLRRRR